MKKGLALLLTAAMLAAMSTGCSATKKTSSAESSFSTSSASSSASSQDLSKQSEQHLELYACTMGGNNDSLASINKAINAYIKPILNEDVTIHFLSLGEYATKVNLMMASSDPVDLMMSTGSLTTALVSQDALTPVDSSVAKYGKGIESALGSTVLNGSKIGGKLYAIPTYREFATGYGYLYQTALNDKYKLGLENAKSFDDIEAAFKKLKSEAPNIVGLYGTNTVPPFTGWDWDNLAGNDLGVLLNYGKALTVTNLYSSDEYKQLVERMHRWYVAGYVNRDAATTTVNAQQVLQAGQALGEFINTKPNVDSEETQQFGLSVKCIPLTSNLMCSATLQGAAWTVPHNTSSADRAIQFLNLMYSDKTVYNLLSYGIEGQDWTYSDKANDVIDYPSGKTATTKTWENTLSWQWGNLMLGHIWKGSSLTLHQDYLTYNKNAVLSQALGFTFDPKNVQNEITTCANIQTKYRAGLEWGALDPDTTLAKYNAELKTGGIDTIIQEEQSQLNTWAKSK